MFGFGDRVSRGLGFNAWAVDLTWFVLRVRFAVRQRLVTSGKLVQLAVVVGFLFSLLG